MYSCLQIFLVCTNTGFGFWLNSPFLLFFQLSEHIPFPSVLSKKFSPPFNVANVISVEV